MESEAKHYLDIIEDLRGQVEELVRDLPSDALNWRPIEGTDDHATNSLAVLATHVAGAERFWIAEVVGNYPNTRQRDAEFKTEAKTAAELIDRLNRTGLDTRAVLSAISPTDLIGMRDARGKPVSVRWAILHVIDHTALHLGHMQLTYQLWMGGQGHDAPRWYQRLPPVT